MSVCIDCIRNNDQHKPLIFFPNQITLWKKHTGMDQNILLIDRFFNLIGPTLRLSVSM